MKIRIAKTPWCSRMTNSPRGLHWYTESEWGFQKFWFCHEGLGDFDFDYETATIRLILSNKPFEGSILATVTNEVSSNIDRMLSQLNLEDGDLVYWKPELQNKDDGEQEHDQNK